ncbi:putative patellin [Helianthus debilis subsp. tardiflorus]
MGLVATKQALQDNYPEFVCSKAAFYSMMSQSVHDSKGLRACVCLPAQQKPLKPFSTAVVTVKPATKQPVEIIVNEKCTIVWDLRVVGWEVSYNVEYVSNDETSYTINIQKLKKDDSNR